MRCFLCLCLCAEIALASRLKTDRLIEAQNALGLLHLRNKQFKHAERHFRSSLELDDRNGYAHVRCCDLSSDARADKFDMYQAHLAIALKSMEKYRQALPHFQCEIVFDSALCAHCCEIAGLFAQARL